MDNRIQAIYDEYLKNPNDQETTDTFDTLVFNKEKYTKFYDLVINVILFFILHSYETQFKKLDNNFNLESLNNDISDYTKTLDILKIQLNIYWTTIVNNRDTDQLIIDIKDLLKMNIIRHQYCLFTFIKNIAISIIKDIARIKLEGITNFTEFTEKIALLANSILQINKITMLEDEDDFDCNECIYELDKNIITEVFWP